MKMSEVSSKRVTFSDSGDTKQVPPRKTSIAQSKQNPIVRKTTSSRSSYISKAGDAKKDNSGKLPLPPGSSSSATTTKHSRPTSKVRKSLVRNCDFSKPVENVRVTRPTSNHIIPEERLLSGSSNYPSSLSSHASKQSTLSMPIMQSNLDTYRKIRTITEMSLETAASKYTDLEVDQVELARKVSSLAVNVPQTERLFNNLVSVDFSENQLKPKKMSSYPLKGRERMDPTPSLEDFFQEKNDKPKLWPKFPPISISFQPVDLYDGRSVLNVKQSLQDCSKKLLDFKRLD